MRLNHRQTEAHTEIRIPHFFPDAHIVSFEPLPGPAAKYRKVFGDDRNATLYPVAIGTQQATIPIHVSRRYDSSSLLPITDEQDWLFPGAAERTTQTVQVGRLGDYLQAKDIVTPALLKLDVLGHELEALKGCEGLLERFAYVYVECSFVELYSGQALADEVVAWLRVRGFCLRGVYNMSYDQDGRAV